MSSAMSSVDTGSGPSYSTEQALGLIDLADSALRARRLENLADSVLPITAQIMRAPVAMLYIADSRLLAPHFLACGTLSQTASELERLCATQFEQLSSLGDLQPVSISAPLSLGTAADLVLYPWRTDNGCSGLLGLAVTEGAGSPSPEIHERLLRMLANTVDRLVERAESDRQLTHLNTYLTVSSMLVQSLELHDTLEGVLFCCMDAVSAEAASVLLLDDDMANFRFYHVAGPAESGLKGATLPADEGIAGHVLRTLEPLIISDVQSDPRFSASFDSDSGFQTKNMIAIPLVIGEEPIGVLEVLNKSGGGSFTPEEQMLLVSVAEEIALAIRNAKVFEFVANSYCKRRQGHSSCRGCDRPLGAWTPCVQYQKVEVSGLWRLSDMPDFGTSG
jgi:GAF domain-containing protein